MASIYFTEQISVSALPWMLILHNSSSLPTHTPPLLLVPPTQVWNRAVAYGPDLIDLLQTHPAIFPLAGRAEQECFLWTRHCGQCRKPTFRVRIRLLVSQRCIVRGKFSFCVSNVGVDHVRELAKWLTSEKQAEVFDDYHPLVAVRSACHRRYKRIKLQ